MFCTDFTGDFVCVLIFQVSFEGREEWQVWRHEVMV